MKRSELKKIIKKMLVEEAVEGMTRDEENILEDLIDFAWTEKPTVEMVDSYEFQTKYLETKNPDARFKMTDKINAELKRYVEWERAGRPGDDFVINGEIESPTHKHRFEQVDSLGNTKAIALDPDAERKILYSGRGARQTRWISHSLWDFVNYNNEGRTPPRAEVHGILTEAMEEACKEANPDIAMRIFSEVVGMGMNLRRSGWKAVK
jgi:hypothetical protein